MPKGTLLRGAPHQTPEPPTVVAARPIRRDDKRAGKGSVIEGRDYHNKRVTCKAARVYPLSAQAPLRRFLLISN